MNRSDYISLDEATKRLGVVRGTMHYYLRTLNIKTEKFPLDRRAYILKTDFENIQKLRQDAKNVSEDAKQPPVRDVEELVTTLSQKTVDRKRTLVV